MKGEDRAELKRSILAGGARVWAEMVAAARKHFASRGSGPMMKRELLMKACIESEMDAPILYMYGPFDKMFQFYRLHAIKVAKEFTAGDAAKLGIPAFGTFPEGTYAFDIPPWSGKVTESHMIRAAYGDKKLQDASMRFDTFLAFVPDIWHWELPGHYAYPGDTITAYHWVKQTIRDRHAVVSMDHVFAPGGKSVKVDHMWARVITIGSTMFGRGSNSPVPLPMAGRPALMSKL